MHGRKRLRVLIATDGSRPARAALATAADFPWPERVALSGVVASEILTKYGAAPSTPVTASGRPARAVADAAELALARGWPDVDVRVVPGAAVAAVLREAKRTGADVIVMGWRGHGTVRRLLCGSVSRGVVRQAPCAVLVVRRATHDVKRIVLGFDGSAHARRAVALVGALRPPRGGRVVLVSATDPLPPVPAHALVPADLRARMMGERLRINAEREAAARRSLESPARRLEAAGWKVDARVAEGAPLDALLAAVKRERAQLLVVGARGKSRLEHLMVGSVAEGALDRSPVPTLIAR